MNKTSPRTPEQEIRRLKDVNKKLRKDLATVERMYGDLSSWKVDAHCWPGT